MRFGTAVVVGKFLPPHAGHHFLIDRAQAESARVTVIVCEKPTDPIPGDTRGGWLREAHPAATVLVIDDRYDTTDSRVWAENTVRWLGGPPDAVFTSEDYGDAYAGHMGCVHVKVDPPRATVPCSGTAIRENPYENWRFLRPPARAWYAKRVCLLGAESTGTTTLAGALAEALETVWVPEYGREYSAEKLSRGEAEWASDEFVHIAEEQTRREDAAAREANRVLVCDTNAFATVLWHRRYMGCEEPRVRSIAACGRCDLYLLTGDEIPFVQDGLRDGEGIRHPMHGWFEEELANQPVPWKLLRGDRDERLRAAVTAVRELFPVTPLLWLQSPRTRLTTSGGATS